MLYLFAAVFSFGYSGLPVLMPSIIAQLFGLSSHGVIYGVVGLGWTAGGTIGPPLAGHIFDITGRYQLAFLICAIIAVMGIILTLLLKPTRGKGGKNDSKRST